MRLLAYIDLIKTLPYKEQSFKTNKETWVNDLDDYRFDKFCNTIFVNPTVEISRGELLSKVGNDSFSDDVFSIILWGYPNGYTRPNTMSKLFPQFLKSLSDLEKLMSDDLTKKEFENLLKLKGIGLSTITKILYFFQIKVEGVRCLILDSRIIKVLQNRRFDELKELCEITEFSKHKQYFNYISLLTKISNEYECEPDQLELFLFMFGNNLKG